MKLTSMAILFGKKLQEKETRDYRHLACCAVRPNATRKGAGRVQCLPWLPCAPLWQGARFSTPGHSKRTVLPGSFFSSPGCKGRVTKALACVKSA
ncbi:MAG: hypothetical protein Q4D74_10170 [Comamonadaceae bacterium]|nr:hypothetical protein [Comamonadaceae bacterium]